MNRSFVIYGVACALLFGARHASAQYNTNSGYWDHHGSPSGNSGSQGSDSALLEQMAARNAAMQQRNAQIIQEAEQRRAAAESAAASQAATRRQANANAQAARNGQGLVSAAQGAADALNEGAAQRVREAEAKANSRTGDVPPLPEGFEATGDNLTASQVAQQVRAYQRQQAAAQRAADTQARAEAKAAAAEAKLAARENGVVESEYKATINTANSRANAALKDEDARLDQRLASTEYWSPGDSSKARSRGVDWKKYDQQVESWKQGLDAMGESAAQVPNSRSSRPTMGKDGKVLTREQQAQISDNDYLKLIRSPHAKY